MEIHQSNKVAAGAVASANSENGMKTQLIKNNRQTFV